MEACREAHTQTLDQARPGQLGTFTRRMAEAGAHIEVLYSDHDNQLVVVVDDPQIGAAVSKAWTMARSNPPDPR